MSEPTVGPDRIKTAHFRIVMPPGMKGTLHAAVGAKLFVTLPGQPEVQVPGTWEIDWHAGLDDATSLTVKLYGSVEVEYP